MTSTPRSLVLATDIDVLSIDHTVTRRDDYVVVHSPSNPTFWFGNFLIFDGPPRPGDAQRWERRFEREFADEPRVRHRTFRWDRTDGETGAVAQEFTVRGYDLESVIGWSPSRTSSSPTPGPTRRLGSSGWIRQPAGRTSRCGRPWWRSRSPGVTRE